jgi:hypothetical protein
MFPTTHRNAAELTTAEEKCRETKGNKDPRTGAKGKRAHVGPRAGGKRHSGLLFDTTPYDPTDKPFSTLTVIEEVDEDMETTPGPSGDCDDVSDDDEPRDYTFKTLSRRRRNWSCKPFTFGDGGAEGLFTRMLFIKNNTYSKLSGERVRELREGKETETVNTNQDEL